MFVVESFRVLTQQPKLQHALNGIEKECFKAYAMEEKAMLQYDIFQFARTFVVHVGICDKIFITKVIKPCDIVLY